MSVSPDVSEQKAARPCKAVGSVVCVEITQPLRGAVPEVLTARHLDLRAQSLVRSSYRSNIRFS
jgi:hypothetical protein